MDINWLVQTLSNGETYTVNNDIGEPYQQNRPPTHISIKAAKVIVEQNKQINYLNSVTQNLQGQINELIDQLETHKNSNPSPTAS